MGKYTAVEDCLNIYENRLWYQIPGFRGYEISNDMYIRSMKHFKKYPYGILIKPKKVTESSIVFELSNNNNDRISMEIKEIIDLVNKNGQSPGWPRSTIITNTSSRNLRITKRLQEYPQKIMHYDPINGWH